MDLLTLIPFLNLTQLVWSNGDTSLQISNLTAGSYELQLENVLGCDTTLTYVIAEYDDLDVNIFVTPTQCDTNTGTAAALLTATTFYPPYTYLWSNGDNSSSNADSLYSGPLTVQITDGNNCTSYHTTFVGDMDGPSINLVNIQDVSCNGFSDGTIDLDITGSGDLDIEWLTGEKTEDLSNLSGGIYTVTVTDTSNCFSTFDFTIEEPAPLYLDTLNLNVPTCGLADGSILVSAQGGTPPYNYIWGINTGLQQGPNAQNLGAGMYQLTLIDSNNCNLVSQFSLNNISPDIIVDSVIDPSCNGTAGGIYITVLNTSGSHQYLWSTGDTIEDLTNISQGNYVLTVTDSTGCQNNVSFDLFNQTPPIPDICLITVDSAKQTNLIVWEKPDLNPGWAAYRLYRESSSSNAYQLVDEVPFDSLSQYTDTMANPSYRSWSYKLSVVDTCGIESPLSPEHKTIHLSPNVGLQSTVNLIWDHYNGFSYPTYYIVRYHPDLGWSVDSISSSFNSYTDNDTALANINFDSLMYNIQIYPPNVCTSSKSVDHNHCRSNRGRTSGAVDPNNNTNPNVGIDELESIYWLYPNPTENWIYIENSSKQTIKRIEVYNVEGRLIYSNSPNHFKSYVWLDQYADGLYFVHLTSSNETLIKKVIKQ